MYTIRIIYIYIYIHKWIVYVYTYIYIYILYIYTYKQHILDLRLQEAGRTSPTERARARVTLGAAQLDPTSSTLDVINVNWVIECKHLLHTNTHTHTPVSLFTAI